MYNSIIDLNIEELNKQGVEVRPFHDDEFSVPKDSGAGRLGYTHVNYAPARIKVGVDLYLSFPDMEEDAHERLEFPFSQEALDEAIISMEYAIEDFKNEHNVVE